MECTQCGATLRPNARFCNVCGARQDVAEAAVAAATVQPAATAATTEVAGTTPAPSTAPASAEMDDSGARLKRPPRVPRAQDDDDDDGSQAQAPAADSISAAPVESAAPETSAPDAPDTASASAERAEAAIDAPADSEASADDDVMAAEPIAPLGEEASSEEIPTVATAPTTDGDVGAEALEQPAQAPDTSPAKDAPDAPDAPATPASEEPTVAEAGETPAAPTTPEPEAVAPWEDAETVEQGVVAGLKPPAWLTGEPVGSEDASVAMSPMPPMAPMPPLSQLSRSAAEPEPGGEEYAEEAPSAVRADGLSWPLPVSIIVGGRYRVESLVYAAPDEPGAENIYRVTDLQGYERCWSCGTEYGSSGASDRFCRECGADMLAREFLMYERSVPTEETETAAEEDMGAEPTDVDHDAETLPEIEIGTGKSAQAMNEDVRSFVQGARSYRVQPRIVEPSPFPQGARIVAAVATDVGATRSGERNEDSQGLLVLNLSYDSHVQSLGLALVADGLGGHVNGQDASRLVVRTVTNQILRAVGLSLVDLPADGAATEEGLQAVLKDAVRAANQELCTANDESGGDMGSTVVAALLFGSTAYVANVGDSRGYVLEDSGLRRITTDHSLVEQLIVGGFVKPEDRYTHPQRNQIYRSLGDEPDMPIDVFTQKLRPGVRLLLCSDGLWEMVRDDEIERILRETAHPQQACDLLVHQANEHGGEDNISALVIEVSA